MMIKGQLSVFSGVSDQRMQTTVNSDAVSVGAACYTACVLQWVTGKKTGHVYKMRYYSALRQDQILALKQHDGP